ncbi:MAG: hypothetical protein K6A32_00720, partial [Bacteroidales bacterium]|nr:hypothetical protein [Bacteroidales bacterium]
PRPYKIAQNDGITHSDGTVVGNTSETERVVIKKGTDAINGVATPATTVTETYDVAGRRMTAPRRVINIIRTADGKAKKVVRK